MQRANKNRHIRRCEIVLEGENPLDKTEEREEQNEDDKTDFDENPKIWECPGCKKSMQRANKNRHTRRCEIFLEAENPVERTSEREEQHEDSKTDSVENPKMWECPGCKKRMQRANKNRHIRRCELNRDNSVERTG